MMPRKIKLAGWLTVWVAGLFSLAALAEWTVLAPAEATRWERGSKKQIVRWQVAEDTAENRVPVLIELRRGWPPERSERVFAHRYFAKRLTPREFVTAINVPDTAGKHWLRIVDPARPSDPQTSGQSAVFTIVDPRRDLEIGGLKNVDGILHATVYSRQDAFDGNVLFLVPGGRPDLHQTRLVRMHIEATEAGDYTVPGESVSLGIRVEPPLVDLPSACGTWYVAYMDPYGNVPETDRSNNRWEGPIYHREHSVELVEPVRLGWFPSSAYEVSSRREVVVSVPSNWSRDQDTLPMAIEWHVHNCGRRALSTDWSIRIYQYYLTVNPDHPLEEMEAVRVLGDATPRDPIEPGETGLVSSYSRFLWVNSRIVIASLDPSEVLYAFELRFVDGR